MQNFSFHQLGYTSTDPCSVPGSYTNCGQQDINMGMNANCCQQPLGPSLTKLTTGATFIASRQMTPSQMARIVSGKMASVSQARAMNASAKPMIGMDVQPNAVGIL